MDPLLDGNCLGEAMLLAGVLSLPLFFHILPHIQDMAKDDPLVKLEVSIFIPRGQLGVVFPQLPPVTLLGIYGVKL